MKAYKMLKLVNTKGLFNRSISVDNKKRIKFVMDEIEKKN